MPYIAQSAREKFDPLIEELSNSISAEAVDAGDETVAAGHLNYVITRLILSVFRMLFTRRKYWHFALIKGLLVDVSDEIARRLQIDFEENKKELNGDVPEFEEL